MPSAWNNLSALSPATVGHFQPLKYRGKNTSFLLVGYWYELKNDMPSNMSNHSNLYGTFMNLS